MGHGRTADDEGGRRDDALPLTYRDSREQPDPESVTTYELEVDGELFALRQVVDPATGYTDTGYDWLTGPNAGYGFAVGGPPDPSPAEHRDAIRAFLGMVDPTTGYIED